MLTPHTQPACSPPVLHVYEHRQTILQWPASVPRNIPNHAQLISRDKQAAQPGDSQDSTLSSHELQ